MTAPPLRLGLVGAGRWGRRYMQTIGTCPGTELVAVTSRNPATAELLDTGCQIFDRWQRMLDAATLDALVLAVPPQLHRAIAAAAIGQRLPVLVEKPLATSLADAEHLAAAARAARTLVVVDHTHLFSLAFQGLQQRIGPGPLRIRSAGGSWGPFGRPVSALWDWGPHDVAMALALARSRPASQEVTPRVSGPGDRLIVDLALRFVSGTTADMTVGNALARKRRRLEVDDGSCVYVYDDLAPDRLTRRTGARYLPIPVAAEPPLRRAVEAFERAVRSDAVSHSSLALGVDVVRVLESADRAMAGP